MSRFRPSRDRKSVEGREVKRAGVCSTPDPTVGGASSVTYPSRGSSLHRALRSLVVTVRET